MAILIPDGFTREELIESVERELRLRERVYARQVELGKLSHKTSEHEKGAMRAVLAVLRQLPATPPAQPGLFGAEGGRTR